MNDTMSTLRDMENKLDEMDEAISRRRIQRILNSFGLLSDFWLIVHDFAH